MSPEQKMELQKKLELRKRLADRVEPVIRKRQHTSPESQTIEWWTDLYVDVALEIIQELGLVEKETL